MRRFVGSTGTLLITVYASIYAMPSLAQNAVSTGTISGSVHDASGAVLPNVAVTLTGNATGIKLSAKSNADGLFIFPALQVGSYSASFSVAGFKATEIDSLQVGVGHTTEAQAVLQIGDVSQQVVVQASDSGVDPSDTTVGTLITKSTIDGLPLSGRRYTDFVLLTPNVTADGQFGHISFAGQSGGDLSGYNNTSGGASNANGSTAFTVDGSDATSYYYGDNRGFTRIPYIFGLNAIQEFQVQPNVYNAAYGGAGAGFINTVTKSGTNALHGDLFYYNRNSGTGANDAVDKAAGNPKLQNTLQQFGADIGGPIKKEKLFFYFDYEQQRHRDPLYAVNQGQSAIDETSFGVPAGTQLPTPNSHFPVAANISQDQATANPLNTTYLQGVSNALHEIKSNLGPRARRRDDLEFFPKIDWQIGPKDSLTALYNYNTFKSPGGIITFSPEAFGADELLGNNGVKDHDATVHWTHIFGSTAVNDVHASYVRDEQYYTPSGLDDPTAPEIILTAPQTFLMGNATFSYNNLREYQWQLADHFTLTKGAHEIEMGVDFNHDAVANNNPGTFNGQYIFLSLQAFALGKWNIFDQTTGNSKFNFSDPFTGFYVNDTWRARPNLTFTGGLREDFQIYPNPSGNPLLPFTQKFNNQYQRLSPRLGFSYSPLPKTVIRGGMGLYYEVFVGGNYQNSTQTNGILQTSLGLTDFSTATVPDQQAVVFPNKLASSDPNFSGATNITAIAPNFKTPSVVNASLQIDQQIAPHTTVTVGSLWSHGMHITASTAYDANLERPTGTTTYTLPNGTTIVEPNLDTSLLKEGAISSSFGQINELFSPGIDNYVSLFTQLNRQVAHGANVIMAYTYAKSTQSGVDFYNQFDLGETRGPSLLDQRHRLSIGAVYSPQVSSENATTQKLLSGWTVSTISQFNSGRPYTGVISTLNDTAALQATPNTAAGLVGGNSPGYGLAPGDGINSFTGPWITEIDLGLERKIVIHENQNIALKAQVFNLFNSANYYVEAGSGINQVQYNATGTTCGDGKTLDQACTLTANNGTGGFQTFTAIAQPNPPRILQFSFGYNF
jgi:hypothetical protein